MRKIEYISPKELASFSPEKQKLIKLQTVKYHKDCLSQMSLALAREGFPIRDITSGIDAAVARQKELADIESRGTAKILPFPRGGKSGRAWPPPQPPDGAA